MRKKMIKKLCCPFDKSDLDLKVIASDLEGDVLEGYLTCTSCRRIYPIIKGIPIMSPDEYREPALEEPLMEHWKEHLSGGKYESFRLISAEGEEDGLE